MRVEMECVLTAYANCVGSCVLEATWKAIKWKQTEKDVYIHSYFFSLGKTTSTLGLLTLEMHDN